MNLFTNLCICMNSQLQYITFFHYHYLFCCSNCPRLFQWEPLQDDLCVSIILWVLLISASTVGSRLILHSLYPNTIVNHISKDLWRMVLGKQDLNATCTQCFWDITASRCFQWTKLGIYAFKSLSLSLSRVSLSLSLSHTHTHVCLLKTVSSQPYLQF